MKSKSVTDPRHHHYFINNALTETIIVSIDLKQGHELHYSQDSYESSGKYVSDDL